MLGLSFIGATNNVRREVNLLVIILQFKLIVNLIKNTVVSGYNLIGVHVDLKNYSSKFKVCKTVHYRTFKINHQPDAKFSSLLS
jgi:hypothetical protein